MGAAALVLALRTLAVLVRSDRDVLRAVVGGDVRPAQRERRGRHGHQSRCQLLRGRSELRGAHEADEDGAAEHRCEYAGPLERQPRLGERAAVSIGITRDGKNPYATVPNACRNQWLSVKPATQTGAGLAPGSTLSTQA